MTVENQPALRLVFDSILDYAVLTIDLEGNITWCNPGVEQLLGYARDELVGQPAGVIFSDEDRLANAPQHEAEMARTTGRASDDRYHLRKDGTLVWVNGIMTDLRDDSGELIGFVKVMRDRTEERQVQEALRESEAVYRSLLDDVLDASEVGVFILDDGFNVVWLNRAIERYFGLQRQEVIGGPKRELLLTKLHSVVVEPDDFVARLLALHENGSGPERFQLRVRGVGEQGAGEQGAGEQGTGHQREGDQRVGDSPVGHHRAGAHSIGAHGDRWLEHRSKPIHSGPFAGGRIEQYYDITDQKRIEQDLAAARDALESQVQERTADLRALNSELESFNYSVSHDLRAPLRGLTGFSEILLDEYGEHLDDKGRHYLERVSTAAERMGNLIDALLELSRVSRAELRAREADLSELVRSITSSLVESDPAREVDIHIEPGVRAHGDERLLRIALENLLSNAWKFTTEREPTRIEFGVERSAGMDDVYFIRDNGAGFDMAFVEKLFVPFQRLHSPRTFAGLGIGLATVQRIIHRHGGKIWGEGRVGGGAIFYFTLASSTKS